MYLDPGMDPSAAVSAVKTTQHLGVWEKENGNLIVLKGRLEGLERPGQKGNRPEGLDRLGRHGELEGQEGLEG